MKAKESKTPSLFSIITGIGLIVVAILFATEILVHCTRKPEPVKQQTMASYNHDTITFDITQVMAVEDSGDETGFKITYATSDSTFIEMYTSTMEGDYLLYSLDCLALYEDFEDMNAIDKLQSYFIGNSHISYLNNPWFEGFTWTWDSCPIFRYPHP